MKIRILAVGKIKENWLKKGIEEYRTRISRFCETVITEIPDIPEGSDPGRSVSKEGESLLSKIRDGEIVVALDAKGDPLDSEGLSVKLDNWMIRGGANVTFVIGGSNGLSGEVIKRADEVLSLSNLTFPHRLVRLIFLEQIYRAFKISNNEKYHK